MYSSQTAFVYECFYCGSSRTLFMSDVLTLTSSSPTDLYLTLKIWEVMRLYLKLYLEMFVGRLWKWCVRSKSVQLKSWRVQSGVARYTDTEKVSQYPVAKKLTAPHAVSINMSRPFFLLIRAVLSQAACEFAATEVGPLSSLKWTEHFSLSKACVCCCKVGCWTTRLQIQHSVNHPQLVKKVGTQSKIWHYFAYGADG